MSNDKSKAVQIAEKLSPDLPTILRIDAEAAGDELRRLDAVNRELLEAVRRYVAQDVLMECVDNNLHKTAVAAIEKAEDV